MTSIKGHNSVANFRKLRIYNPNVDLVNNNVYTKFGLNKFIRSQDIEKTEFRLQSMAVTLLQICEKLQFTIPT